MFSKHGHHKHPYHFVVKRRFHLPQLMLIMPVHLALLSLLLPPHTILLPVFLALFILLLSPCVLLHDLEAESSTN